MRSRLGAPSSTREPDLVNWPGPESDLPANGEVLVSEDDAGRCADCWKQHNADAHELAVATEPARGLIRLLVAQGAGRVPGDREVSRRLRGAAKPALATHADGAGCPDRGRRVFGLLPVRHPAP